MYLSFHGTLYSSIEYEHAAMNLWNISNQQHQQPPSLSFLRYNRSRQKCLCHFVESVINNQRFPVIQCKHCLWSDRFKEPSWQGFQLKVLDFLMNRHQIYRYLLVLVTGTSQSRQHGKSESEVPFFTIDKGKSIFENQSTNHLPK